jgi:glutathione peroxidase
MKRPYPLSGPGEERPGGRHASTGFAPLQLAATPVAGVPAAGRQADRPRRGARLARLLLVAGLALGGGPALADCPQLFDHRFPTLLDETPSSLCQYAGKVVLVVNTASYCGFTKQYQGLEALHRRYGPQGLVVLGFPANDFGAQEPGSNAEIAEFCRNTYDVRFPMFAKSSVTGPQANPLFVQLATASGQAPQWNFHKYLIDRRGERVLSFGSRVAPDDRRLRAQIEALLAERRPPARQSINPPGDAR